MVKLMSPSSPVHVSSMDSALQQAIGAPPGLEHDPCFVVPSYVGPPGLELNRKSASSISDDMKVHIGLMIDTGMSRHEILNEFGPKWQASVRKYLDLKVKEVKLGLNDGVKSQSSTKIDTSTSGCKIVNECEVQLQISASNISDDMKSYIRSALDKGKSRHEVMKEFGRKWHVSVRTYLDEVVGQESQTIIGIPSASHHNAKESHLVEAAIVTGVTTKGSLECGGACIILWKIAAKKLGSKDKQIVSPEFLIDIPNVGQQPFKMSIFPARARDRKGGAGFTNCQGRGRLEIKYVGKSLDVMPTMAFHIGVGEGGLQKPRGPIEQNFTLNTCCLPKSDEEWDFSSAIHEATKTFTIGLACNLLAR